MTTHSPPSTVSDMRALRGLVLGGLALVLSACGGTDAPSAAPSDPVIPGAECIDQDGDGFGVNCVAGTDCDDNDASVSNQCYRCDAPGSKGCECPAEGEKINCGKMVSNVGDQIVCGAGIATCENGRWGECIINNSVTLALPTNTKSALALGNPQKCSDPCNPYCHTWNDTPTGVTDPDGDTQSTPGGISLPQGNPPIPPSLCSSPKYRGCDHHVCATGPALSNNCDTANLPCTRRTRNGRTYLFCNFSRNYNQAAAYCQKQGMNLVTINDSGEQNWIRSNAPGYTSWWIGLDDKTTEGQFGWEDGSPISYLNWNGGEPNDWGGNEDCTEWREPGNRWNDLPCSYGRRFICEGVPETNSCVSQVCAAQPSCCTAGWSSICVTTARNLCNIDCAADADGQCMSCYQDNKDHDGDGYSFAQGDCRDCDPLVNPGSYDFPANGRDEDCSGTADDEPEVCDGGLPMDSSAGANYARAIDLCRFTTENASGAARTWGVIRSNLRRANRASSPRSRQRGILNRFGTWGAFDPTAGVPQNAPRLGARMAAFSSGSARDRTQSGFINPSGQMGSYNADTWAPPPAGFPKNAAGCPNGSAARDSAGLDLRIRVPKNAQSFTYNFNFFSSEYPEWLCTAFNDSFIAVLTNSNHPLNMANLAGSRSGNISFDNNNNPVSVNVGFFSVPGNPWSNHPKLLGTGYDGWCNGQICGGGTDWLQTSAPVLAGETMELFYNIWDTGDHRWDSTVLIDNFRWSPQSSGIQTIPDPPDPPPTFFPGSFDRDYDATNICPDGSGVVWGLWSWGATTPTDTRIRFWVRTAATAAGLASAPEVPIIFTNPPGPAGLVNTQAIARTSPTNTTTGSAYVEKALQAAGQSTKLPFLRVRSELLPSSSNLEAPTLTSWNLQVHCPPSE